MSACCINCRILKFKLLSSTELCTCTDRILNLFLIPAIQVAEIKDWRNRIDQLLNLIQSNDHTITANLIILIINYQTSISNFSFSSTNCSFKISPARLSNYGFRASLQTTSITQKISPLFGVSFDLQTTSSTGSNSNCITQSFSILIRIIFTYIQAWYVNPYRLIQCIYISSRALRSTVTCSVDRSQSTGERERAVSGSIVEPFFRHRLIRPVLRENL